MGKELRIQKGLSQEELALTSNLDRTYITYVENAKKNVTIETLYKITNALDISLSEFFNVQISNQNKNIKKDKLSLSINDLIKNNIYTNQEISSIFNCSTQGGIRINSNNKTATIISHSNSKTNPYKDSDIKNNTFVYTGMGLKGDQIVKPTNQNGKIAFSNENGFVLYYFIAIDKNKYQYIGKAKLKGNYYFEEEKDYDGNLRKVVKFPLYII